MEILNSSGFKIGEAKIDEDLIIIDNNNKPLLVIEDESELIQQINTKDESGFKKLFEEYHLLIGEIAALYNMTYSTTRKHLIKQGIDTKSKAGRRNSSYGKTFSEERKANIGAALRGRKIVPYERTPEIKSKISESLKQYYARHEVSEETRLKLSQAWKDGKYENANMGRGYSGFFYSIKNNRKFFFRSLLELCYLIKIENDENVKFYCVEPFQIQLPDNHHYTPDIFLNGEILIELKPKKHLLYENKDRWNLEISSAKEYCNNHNLTFKVIYDEDLDFRTDKFKRWLLNNKEKVEKYQITFSSKDIWSQK